MASPSGLPGPTNGLDLSAPSWGAGSFVAGHEHGFRFLSRQVFVVARTP